MAMKASPRGGGTWMTLQVCESSVAWRFPFGLWHLLDFRNIPSETIPRAHIRILQSVIQILHTASVIYSKSVSFTHHVLRMRRCWATGVHRDDANPLTTLEVQRMTQEIK